MNDRLLPESYRDHKFIGNWPGFRECHLKPDLLFIYFLTTDGLKLKLARIGSHSDLFA
ncbi:MAG: type II toxin-antitoxin system mRNA interferase toxin, RelE/StbE family [Gammaproteobacteria bacterium]|nr:type II toxin-antitoxin system mRNA interferase toxin, RelE/StbE family [Gammaproteobacteria bacterium]